MRNQLRLRLDSASSEVLARSALLMLALLLGACGGGGADSVSSNPGLRFVPSTVNETLFEGDTREFTVQAFPQQDFAGYLAVIIEDSAGVVRSDPTISDNGDGSYSATFKTARNLAPGQHRGQFVVKLCRDSACSAQHPGSPVSLPYVLTVQSHTNITPLGHLDGAGDWSMFQVNAAHTGYVPVTLDASKFSPRWIWRYSTSDDATAPVSPPVIANGLVYVTVGGNFGPASLYALRESDGDAQWQYGFGSLFTVNPPSVANGLVYAASSGHENTFMWLLDAGTGTLKAQTSFQSQWERYYSPTLYGNSVYTNGGYYGGASAFNALDGGAEWFAELQQFDEWTPAVDDNYVYAYLGDSCSGCANAGLQALNRSDGSLAFSISDLNFDWKGWSITSAPIIGSSSDVLAINQAAPYGTNRLIRFNIATRSIDWSVQGTFMAQPALAKGVVYVGDNSTKSLRALRESDGTLVWAWSLPASDWTSLQSNIVVTDNLAFVVSEKATYAIDLGTHQAVWSYPYSGAIAISDNGVLYVARSDGALGAINLR